ncbi:MAG: FG-GAP-like repeat-containing protein, partial [Pyrinomonadaceae bacterium]|nr:FG-GAP-like repeat-containing protein [Pyrinomonadaceae bacterium]
MIQTKFKHSFTFRYFAGALFIITAIFSTVAPTRAADGDLDTSFDGDGKVITNGFLQNGGRDVVVQPDGKIIIVGGKKTPTFTLSNMVAVRYNADGSLDATFGTNGEAVVTFLVGGIASNSASAVAVALQSDGKILLGGSAASQGVSNPNFALVRLNANGTLDTTFGSGGRVITDVTTDQNDLAASMVFDETRNKIYLAGISRTAPDATFQQKDLYAVVRYNGGDGSLDTTFNGTGKQLFPVGDSTATLTTLYDIALQSDGKTVVTGRAIRNIVQGEYFATARINLDGSLDAGFGGGGIVLTNFPSGQTSAYSVYARTLSILPNGKIFVAGEGAGFSNYAAAQYNADGSLDSSFGTGGKIYGTSLRIADSALQSNGKIAVAGLSNNGSFVVGRLNANGSPDTTFGTNGVTVTSFNFNGNNVSGTAFAVALQTDGKIVASGGAVNEQSNAPGNDFFLVARYGDNPPSIFLNFTGLQNNEYPREFYNGGAGSLGSTGGTNYNVSFVINGNGFEGGIVETAFTSPQIRNDTRKITVNVPRGFTRASFKYARPATGNTGICFVRSLSGVSLGGTELGRLELPETSAASGFDTASQPVTTFQFSGTARSLEFNCGGNQMAIDDIALSSSPLVNNPTLRFADFDGDTRTDVSVFRNGIWYVNPSGSPSFAPTAAYGIQFGQAGDVTVPADYDGDGKSDIAVWRAGDFANFYILNSSNNTFRAEQFGKTGDNPTVAGDWDADGKADLAVYRGAAQSFFYYRPSSQPGVNFIQIQWGTSEDTPIFGDFDGDRKLDATVYRPSQNTFYVRRSSDGTFQSKQWGNAQTDAIFAGDFDGDGKSDFAVQRFIGNDAGTWYVAQSGGTNR